VVMERQEEREERGEDEQKRLPSVCVTDTYTCPEWVWILCIERYRNGLHSEGVPGNIRIH